MNHLDLFSGIGGFAYAVDQVWPGSTHTFCDNNLFCQKVLAKHWPESKIYGDIRTITDTEYQRPVSSKHQERTRCEEGAFEGHKLSDAKTDLLTGGFPCQSFSQAGKRRGTADDRYLWPEMLRVIQLTKPTWIIGENVGGFVTWNEGMVLEQVCADLENEGYEVQPFIIPACAVNAPHRRDRVWIIGNSKSQRQRITRLHKEKLQGKIRRSGGNRIAVNTGSKGFQNWDARKVSGQAENQERKRPTGGYFDPEQFNQDWLEVAGRLCRVDDGLPGRVDRLKSLGNAIVPKVAIQIMKAIKTTYV